LGNKNKSNNSKKRIRREEAHKGKNTEEDGEQIMLQSEIIYPNRKIYMAESSAKDASATNITPSIITSPRNNNLIDVANVFETDETFFGQEEDTVSFGENEDEDLYNYINNTIITNSNEDCDLYDWIADSASTSHICNKREAFTEYLPVHAEIPIFGVSGITMRALG